MTLKREHAIVRLISVCLILSLLTSCTEQKFLFVFNRVSVKKAPVDTPFVFDNKINIIGIADKDEKKRLTNELENYWDDSLYATRVQKFGVFYSLKNPPVF
jgi:hypothetical protein